MFRLPGNSVTTATMATRITTPANARVGTETGSRPHTDSPQLREPQRRDSWAEAVAGFPKANNAASVTMLFKDRILIASQKVGLTIYLSLVTGVDSMLKMNRMGSRLEIMTANFRETLHARAK